jgi:hypothetical protein
VRTALPDMFSIREDIAYWGMIRKIRCFSNISPSDSTPQHSPSNGNAI